MEQIIPAAPGPSQLGATTGVHEAVHGGAEGGPLGITQPREQDLEEHAQRGDGAREGDDGGAAGAVQHSRSCGGRYSMHQRRQLWPPSLGFPAGCRWIGGFHEADVVPNESTWDEGGDCSAEPDTTAMIGASRRLVGRMQRMVVDWVVVHGKRAEHHGHDRC